MPPRFQLVARTGHPSFLDLPWDEPLESWQSDRIVEVVRGIHRHVVRFVEYDGRLYAFKELPDRLAQREWRLLRRLAAENMPVVDVVGVVSRPSLESVLITRHLEYSLPLRALFESRAVTDLRERMLSAGAELLVRLHTAGFFWGDASLSNTLFRRDAGGLAAYLVDSETGELHPDLTDGQRRHDLAILEENVVGELLDVEAATGIELRFDPWETATELVERYESLWNELTREERFGPDERWKLDERLRRLNELGFDVEEIELVAGDDGYRLRLAPTVVEPGHHRRRLLMLTGLDVQENQARRLLNDLASFRVAKEREDGRKMAESVAAYRWLHEIFEPTVAAVPADLRGKLEPAEIFHEVLEHRWFLSESANREVGTDEAARDYVASVLGHRPETRAVLPPTSSTTVSDSTQE
jgi:tRNA A-37 threonylcarbamoyl transferase component Bud32